MPIVFRDLKPRPQAVLFYRLIPSVFHQTLSNIHPTTPLKCDFSIWAGPNTFTFWSANFQIKLAPLILYTTLVYTSTLKSAVQKIFKIFVILIKKILLFFKELSYFLFFNINQCFSEKNRIEVKHTFFFVFGIKISLYNVHYWLVYPFLLSSFWTLYSVLIVWHVFLTIEGNTV